jgi:hypothetical protein
MQGRLFRITSAHLRQFLHGKIVYNPFLHKTPVTKNKTHLHRPFEFTIRRHFNHCGIQMNEEQKSR